ncbi:hypothetical protein BH24GEM2_BH24GEM2_09970 [soil metagenome]
MRGLGALRNDFSGSRPLAVEELAHRCRETLRLLYPRQVIRIGEQEQSCIR